MKAIRVQQFGGPEVLQWEEMPEPQPAAGQVVVATRAIGVNPVDTYIRSGNYGSMVQPPYTPGSDAAGEVLAVGEGVIDVKAGDRVYTWVGRGGAYAEHVLCNQHEVFPLPPNASFEQGAALGVPYTTAHAALF